MKIIYIRAGRAQVELEVHFVTKARSDKEKAQ